MNGAPGPASDAPHIAESAAAPRARERRSVGSRIARVWEGFADVVARVWKKAGDDDIFFMASAIAFNVLIATLPLIVAVVGIAGAVLRARVADPAGFLFDYLTRLIPPVSREFEQMVRDSTSQLIEQSAGLISIGTIIFIWFATRLVGSLRAALKEVFDIEHDRGIVVGKLFDAKMVVLAGTLFTLNIALTVVVEVVTREGLDILGIPGVEFPAAFYGRAVAFLTLFVMFLLIYRYLPARQIKWRTALVAAVFAAVLFEVMKFGFGWYIANIADYRTTFGNLATVAIMFLWIYYSCVVFILGGEVAQVVAMQRVRRRQRERLS